MTIFCVAGQAQTTKPDTAKLLQLKQQLSSSQIVGLGEAGHGFESINESKAVLVELLEKEINVEAVAFESSFALSIVSYMNEKELDLRAGNFLYPFWNTPPVRKALKLFAGKETEAKPLITGFDIQEDCRFEKLSQFLLEKQFITANKERLLACDSVLYYYIGKNYSRKSALTAQEFLLLTQNYAFVEKELNIKGLNPMQTSLLERSLQNRKWLCKLLTLTSASAKMYYRDSLMADNIKWMQKELYSGGRFIVWAANTHIAKGGDDKAPRWMGEWLSSEYQNQYFAVAFQKGAADKCFFWPNTTYAYSDRPSEKFNLVVYLNKLKKIKPEEWITPCK